MADMLAAALAYAETGWEVFPLAPDKGPAFKSPHADVAERKACRGRCGRDGHGFYDASRDEDRIRQWWAARPWLLVAGRIPAHLVMLDVDPRGGGQDTLDRLTADHGPLPDTLTCLSGRGDGGRHLYYVRPPGTQLSNCLTGVDVCHHGLRYAVLPPSPHPVTGKPYRWVDPSVPIAHPPAWLLRLLAPKQHTPPPSWAPLPRTGGPELARWVASFSAQPGSGRHDAVLWALCRAYERGGDPGVVDGIKAAAVSIGKPADEVESMAAWAADEYRGAR